MADLIIPGWALLLMGAFGTIMISWLVWLTQKTNDNDKRIDVNAAFDKGVSDKISSLDEKIDILTSDTKQWVNRIDVKIDDLFKILLAK
jgi:hypothetical protein